MTFLNLSTIKKLSLSILTVLAISACRDKLPVTEFTTNKEEYAAGEIVILTNTSTDAESFIWTMPDGQTKITEDAIFTTNSTMTGSKLVFKLEGFSKKGGKSTYAGRTVSVKAATGRVVLYNGTSPEDESVIVYVDGVYYENTKLPGGSAVPSCGQSGFPTYNLNEGTHTIFVQGTTGWTKTVTVTANGCSVLQVYK